MRTHEGNDIPCKIRNRYLGTTLSEDVHDKQDLLKRIAMAKKDFIALSNVWRRAALTWKRKRATYDAIVETKLLYGLSSICLTAAQERQLNGFQNRCLRAVIGVTSSYISWVSNADVLNKAGHVAATQTLRNRQKQLQEKVARCPEGHPLRTTTFILGSNLPLTERYIGKRGRPYKEWWRTLWLAYCMEFDRDGVLLKFLTFWMVFQSPGCPMGAYDGVRTD